MNTDNIQLAIQVMKRAEQRNSVYMSAWQIFGAAKAARNEEEFHLCGNKACFAGHLAISPEFQALGVSQTAEGSLVYRYAEGSPAVALLLDIPFSVAFLFVNGHSLQDRTLLSDDQTSPFYGKVWKDVTATDVIEKLELLLEKGPEYFG